MTYRDLKDEMMIVEYDQGWRKAVFYSIKSHETSNSRNIIQSRLFSVA